MRDEKEVRIKSAQRNGKQFSVTEHYGLGTKYWSSMKWGWGSSHKISNPEGPWMLCSDSQLCQSFHKCLLQGNLAGGNRRKSALTLSGKLTCPWAPITPLLYHENKWSKSPACRFGDWKVTHSQEEIVCTETAHPRKTGRTNPWGSRDWVQNKRIM